MRTVDDLRDRPQGQALQLPVGRTTAFADLPESDLIGLLHRLEELARIEGLREEPIVTRISSAVRKELDGKVNRHDAPYEYCVTQFYNVKNYGTVGDGVADDTAAIQAALDAANANGGGKILFPPGTYLLGSELNGYDSIELLGTGRETTIIKLKANFGNGISAIVFTNKADIRITGLLFDGNLANQGIVDTTDNKQIAVELASSCSRVLINGCHFKNFGKDGVYISAGSKKITINSNFFENNRRIGVTLIGGDQVVVSDNHFFDGKDQSNVVSNHGVHVESDNNSQYTYNLTIEGNTFKDMHGAVVLYNSQQAPMHNILVVGNTFDTINAKAGVILYLTGSVIVSQNSFKSCGYSTDHLTKWGGAISGSGCAGAVIASNSISSCTGYYGSIALGTACQGVTIIGNKFIDDQKSAIRLSYVYGSETMRQIRGNLCLDGGQAAANTYPAIEIVNITSHVGDADLIANNVIKTDTSSGYKSGIEIDYATGSSIVSGNIIFGNGTKTSFTNGAPHYTSSEEGFFGVMCTPLLPFQVETGTGTVGISNTSMGNAGAGGLGFNSKMDSATPGTLTGSARGFALWADTRGAETTRKIYLSTHTDGGADTGLMSWQADGTVTAYGDMAVKQSFSFMQGNVAANQTDVQLNVLGLAGNTEIVMPYAGSVIGISVASNAARSAGTLAVEPTVNGTGTGLAAQLDDDPTTYAFATQVKDTDVFSAGDRLGVEITTDASWAPTTADIVVTVIVEM